MIARLKLKVKPGARVTGFQGRLGDAWKLCVQAPPVEGKANEAVLRYLADFLDVPKTNIQLLSGQTNSIKVLEISGISSEALERAILETHGS